MKSNKQSHYFFYILWFSTVLLTNQFAYSSPSVQVTEINQGWKFRQSDAASWLPATVPGCVHTDLLNNKKIEDPFFRTNEEKMQWIGEKDWEYSTVFNVNKATLSKEKVELVFQGLDTYADVYLNDVLVLKADNMHRTWRLDCKSRLKENGNTLRIYFHSPLKIGKELRKNAPIPLYQFANNDQEEKPENRVSNYIRKAGYHFGWDWGPRFVTSGIWKSITIEAWNAVKIDAIQYSTQSIAVNQAKMLAQVEIFSLTKGNANLLISNGKETLAKKQLTLVEGLNKISVEFSVQNPKLWWSNGLGKANLYTFNCQLTMGKNTVDEKAVTTGIRTIKVVTDTDKYGKSLYVELNGVPVFMKGANYIPMDNFTNRVPDADYEHIVKSAADSNMNMLRLWAGGYFEKEIFYELCDKYGMLIWHDMLFACGTYPADDQYSLSVTEEIKDNVKRIRNHPSIALWNANNEIEIAYEQWGVKKNLTPVQQVIQEANTKKMFHAVIPAAITSVDSTRYFHSTSPNTGYNNIPNTMGDVHYWDVWHGKKPFETFNTQVGRFMSEYGFQSYPEMESVKQFTLPEDRTLESKVMQAHQKCMADDLKDKAYGNRLIKHYMDQYYKESKDFESYLYVSQILQSKGVKVAIEAHRRNMPKCMGTLFWQINDCWPVASWSSIDYYGRWKALQYAAREVYKEQMISTIIENGKINVYVASDKLSPISGQIELSLLDFKGNVLWTNKIQATIAANNSSLVCSIDEATLPINFDKNEVVLQVKLLENKKELAVSNFYFVPEKEMKLQQPKISIKTTKKGNSIQLTLKSDVLAKDIFVTFPDAKGSYSDNYVDLLPGVEKIITFSPDSAIGKQIKPKVISLFDTY
jgi:beta-mannosidase